LKADDQATRIPFSNMEDASFRKAADKASFLIDGQHPVQNRMVPRLNQWIQNPKNSFRVLNPYRSDSDHVHAALFNPKGDYAVIVLVNIAPDNTAFANLLGEHIAARLEGKAAISLQN
jgi:hypothetical protein